MGNDEKPASFTAMRQHSACVQAHSADDQELLLVSCYVEGSSADLHFLNLRTAVRADVSVP